jgi:NADPH-dependent F420 reductase
MSIIAMIGGTGPLGRGLGYRFVAAGHTVVVGSRAADRAAEMAETIRTRLTEHGVDAAELSGTTNTGALHRAEIAVLAVPWDSHEVLVESLAGDLAGKIIVSCVNPLGFDQHGPYGLTVEESAAEQAQRLVPTARVVGAFHHVAAASLWKTLDPLGHESILVCGDDQEAKKRVMDLATAVTGHVGVDAGALRLARQLEPLTAVLISINKRYKIRSGIAVTGLPPTSEAG